MKKLLVITIAAFTVSLSSTKAQSFGDSVGSFIVTNAAVDVAGLYGLGGKNKILAFTYAKDITTNAGVLLTYDRCFTTNPNRDFQSDQLTGGFTLKTTYKIFTIGMYEEAGVITSKENNGAPINLIGCYVNYTYKNFVVGVLGQNRTEAGPYRGNYVGGHLGWKF